MARSYSTLGVFYYQTGQIDKAREVLNRFKGSNTGGLDVNRIEEVLSRAPATSPPPSLRCPWLHGSNCFSWRYRSPTGLCESAIRLRARANRKRECLAW